MLVCQLTCNSLHKPHGHDVIKCNLDTGFWNKPTPECIPNTPVDPWDPYKHGKCKVPKSHGVGTWSCKTKMYSHDRTDEFEDDGEGKLKIIWCARNGLFQTFFRKFSFFAIKSEICQGIGAISGVH